MAGKRSLLKENSTLLDVGLRIFDPLLVIAAGFLAYRGYLGHWDLPDRYVASILGVGLLAFAVFPSLALYHSQRGISFFEEIRALVLAWFLIGVIGGAFLFLTKTGIEFSRGWALTWIAGGFVAHFLSRAALRFALRTMRRRGRNLRHIVIVGTGSHARAVASRTRSIRCGSRCRYAPRNRSARASNRCEPRRLCCASCPTSTAFICSIIHSARSPACPC